MEDLIKEYLKNNLRIELSEEPTPYSPYDLRVTLSLGEEEVCYDYISLSSMVEN